MIHEYSLLRTIGHTIDRRDFLARTTGVVGAVAIAKNLAAASDMLVAARCDATVAYYQQQFQRSLSVRRMSGATLYASSCHDS